jgi:hypothetical protein
MDVIHFEQCHQEHIDQKNSDILQCHSLRWNGCRTPTTSILAASIKKTSM